MTGFPPPAYNLTNIPGIHQREYLRIPSCSLRPALVTRELLGHTAGHASSRPSSRCPRHAHPSTDVRMVPTYIPALAYHLGICRLRAR